MHAGKHLENDLLNPVVLNFLLWRALFTVPKAIVGPSFSQCFLGVTKIVFLTVYSEMQQCSLYQMAI